jgi:hypothetical protein
MKKEEKSIFLSKAPHIILSVDEIMRKKKKAVKAVKKDAKTREREK